MADRKISELSPLSGADVNANDLAAVADVSANETRKVTIKDLAEAGYRVSADGSLPIAKVELLPNTVDGNVIKDDSLGGQQIAPDSITSSELGDGAVDTAAIQDLAVTTEKLADDIDGAKLADKSVKTEQIGDNAVTIAQLGLGNNELDGAVLQDNSVTATQIAPDAIGTSELANDSVSTDKIQDLAVTTQKLADGIDAAKLADNTVTTSKIADQAITNGKIADATIEGGKIALKTITGGPNGNIALNTITADNIASNSIGSDELADQAVDTAAIQDDAVTGPKLSSDAFNRGIGKDADDKVGIINEITPGAHAGITWDGQGLITSSSTPIPSNDLPIATETEVGAVSIPVDGGLVVDGAGAVRINNTIAAGEGYKISYNDHGLVTGSGAIDGADLPIATASTLGSVKVPNIDTDGDEAPISVSADGSLKHDVSTVVAGTYPKVVVDKYGHVVGGGALDATDIPSIPADKIVGGTLDSALIPDQSITRDMLADYSISYIQEASPTALDPGHIGCLWYQESTGQLRMWNGNSWMPVGFGRLSVDNLRWGGLFDATTGLVTIVTGQGTQAGIKAGDALPVATNNLGGIYFVAEVAGGNVSVTPDETYTVGDWCLCINEEAGWIHIDTNDGGGGGGGGALRLNDLLNVDTGTPADGALLAFNAGTNTWVAATEIDCGTF